MSASTFPIQLAGACPTVLAPMEGVTHAKFRALMVDRGGVGMVCTEFVRIAQDPPRGRAMEKAVVKADGVPLSVQVMGNHVHHMAEATALVAEAGADVVDINLGCPMPRIVRKGVGSAMLENPVLLASVVSAMRAATPGPLSAKIRAGVERSDRAVEIACLLQDCGVDFLTVHPRRQKDRYGGVADWGIVRAIAEELSIPVIGNGDVWYASSAIRLLQRTGVRAVMVGRPALRNPWLFRQVNALLSGGRPERPTGEDVMAFLLEVRTRYGADQKSTLGQIKEILRYLGRAVRIPEFRRTVLRQGTLDDVYRYCERQLCDLDADQLDLDAETERPLERIPELAGSEGAEASTIGTPWAMVV